MAPIKERHKKDAYQQQLQFSPDAYKFTIVHFFSGFLSFAFFILALPLFKFFVRNTTIYYGESITRSLLHLNCYNSFNFLTSFLRNNFSTVQPFFHKLNHVVPLNMDIIKKQVCKTGSKNK